MAPYKTTKHWTIDKEVFVLLSIGIIVLARRLFTETSMSSDNKTPNDLGLRLLSCENYRKTIFDINSVKISLLSKEKYMQLAW